MNRSVGALCFAAILTCFLDSNAQAEDVCAAHVLEAMADPERNEVNVARDERRKPCEVLSFFGVSAGDEILELAGA